MDKGITDGLKEFQYMGVEGSAMADPRMKPTSLQQRREGEGVGFKGCLSKNSGVEREGDVGVAFVVGKRGNEGVVEEDGGV